MEPNIPSPPPPPAPKPYVATIPSVPLPLVILIGVFCLIAGILVGSLLLPSNGLENTPSKGSKDTKQPTTKPSSATTQNTRQQNASYTKPAWEKVSSSSAKVDSMQFEDRNIQSVSTDAEDITSTADYPKGFFSSNPMNWGMVNNSRGPVTVTVVFTQPVRLGAISNVFTFCQGPITNNQDCLLWDVRGLTTDNKTEDLVSAAGNVRKTISSPSSFTQIQITVENVQEVEGEWKPTIAWQKIKLEYL